MQEVIQSLSICCPAKKCINHCETCTARQHDNPYEDKFNGSRYDTFEYWNDVIKRMQYAQDKGCTTVMLTGSVEPQQNRRWLEGLYLAMKSLSKPFLNIEMQTTGAFIDKDYLDFLKAIGVTTLAISTFNIFDNAINKEIEHCADKTFGLYTLCDNAKQRGFNIRICINVTNFMFTEHFRTYDYLNWRYAYNMQDHAENNRVLNEELRNIFKRCSELFADQVTFRKMWSVDGTPEGEWIKKNCNSYCDEFLSTINTYVRKNGKLINVLPYGAARYDCNGFSIVIDIDSMAKDETNMATKYYIIRENGKMYSSWDSKASLVF